MPTVKDLESLVEARTRELSALSTHLQELDVPVRTLVAFQGH